VPRLAVKISCRSGTDARRDVTRAFAFAPKYTWHSVRSVVSKFLAHRYPKGLLFDGENLAAAETHLVSATYGTLAPQASKWSTISGNWPRFSEFTDCRR